MEAHAAIETAVALPPPVLNITEQAANSPTDICQPFTKVYVHKSSPLAVKAKRPTTAAAITAGDDWNTKATAPVATVTNKRDLYNMVSPFKPKAYEGQRYSE